MRNRVHPREDRCRRRRCVWCRIRYPDRRKNDARWNGFFILVPLPIISRVAVAKTRTPSIAPSATRISAVYRDRRAVVLVISLGRGFSGHCLLLFGEHLPVDLVIALPFFRRERLRRLILRGRQAAINRRWPRRVHHAAA